MAQACDPKAVSGAGCQLPGDLGAARVSLQPWSPQNWSPLLPEFCSWHFPPGSFPPFTAPSGLTTPLSLARVRKQVAPVSPFGFIPRHRRVTAGGCGWRPAWGTLHSSGVRVAARAQSPHGLRRCGLGADATVGPRPACLDALLSC